MAFRALSPINEKFLKNTSWFLLFVERIIVPRYLYSSTCIIIFSLWYTLIWPVAPKDIALVLVSFTIILFREQNFSRPWSCLCSPWTVSENRIRSSPHNICITISSDTTTPNCLDRYSLRSDIYLRNMSPLVIPPWLTPILLKIGGLNLPLRFTLKMGFGVQTSKRVYHLPFPPVSYQLIEQNGTTSPEMPFIIVIRFIKTYKR